MFHLFQLFYLRFKFSFLIFLIYFQIFKRSSYFVTKKLWTPLGITRTLRLRPLVKPLIIMWKQYYFAKREIVYLQLVCCYSQFMFNMFFQTWKRKLHFLTRFLTDLDKIEFPVYKILLFLLLLRPLVAECLEIKLRI